MLRKRSTAPKNATYVPTCPTMSFGVSRVHKVRLLSLSSHSNRTHGNSSGHPCRTTSSAPHYFLLLPSKVGHGGAAHERALHSNATRGCSAPLANNTG
jgi:hypothetical protein